MKWGIFGGTFDPIHLGHLRCAEEILEAFALDKIIFVPAHRQPLKKAAAITAFSHRAAMVRLAIRKHGMFTLSDIEDRRGGASYSVETIEYFIARKGEKPELFFIAGQDAFQDVRRWRNWRRLLALCHFVVMTRPGIAMKSLGEILGPDDAARYHYERKNDCFRAQEGTGIYFRKLTFLDISSTEIRERAREGKSIRYLVPEPVREYITRHGLYRDDTSSRRAQRHGTR